MAIFESISDLKMSTQGKPNKGFPFLRKGNSMYLVKMNGEKVAVFKDLFFARGWAREHVKGGNVEIVALTETEMPKASKMRHSGIANYGAYKYNPFAAMQ